MEVVELLGSEYGFVGASRIVRKRLAFLIFSRIRSVSQEKSVAVGFRIELLE
jgi:hypothetical protein